jgi:YD repeat-containing protein
LDFDPRDLDDSRDRNEDSRDRDDERVLDIKGDTASRPSRQYGFFEYGMAVVPGRTNILPFTIWMPKLDTAHQIRIPSPTTNEVVVTTPSIPGLELHLPPQTVIRDEDGKAVTTVGITAIPVDRPPFPLAKNVEVPVYFTIQPGGGYVATSGAGLKGAWLVYPNYRHFEPTQRIQFFHYDPDVKGWYVYGVGTAHAVQVVPDATTRIYAFTGAMINGGGSPGGAGPTPGTNPKRDPIDPSTGLFTLQKTDLYLPDVIPLAVTRTYNSGDGLLRPFGRSMTHPYAMFLWSAQQYQQADLVLPEGGKIHYVRTSVGTSFGDAVFTHQETQTTSATPTPFYKSTIVWNGDGWDLRLKDGTVYVFGENAPLQAMRDRYGNTVTITHASGQIGNVTQVTSPNGHWITFTYDGSNRVTQAKDNISRTVAYTYDGNGNLSTVTDPESNVTTYTYDGSNRLATIKDGRNIVYLTNQYDTSNRVTQ